MTRANGTFRTVVLFCVVSVLGVVASARGALRFDADPPGGTVQLPLSDFTSAQGSTSVFFPPDPDLTAWSGRPPDYPRLGWMDYAGAAGRYLVSIGRPSLGTTVTGTFTRRDVGGGKVEYSVQALVKNALAWCVSLAPDFTLTPLFGAHAFDVAAGATPALGECHASLVWQQNSGTPIADIAASTNVDPGTYAPPGFQLVSFSFRGTASGPLHAASGLGPEGTPGEMVISQTNSNLQSAGKGEGNADAFPAEVMDLHVIGQLTSAAIKAGATRATPTTQGTGSPAAAGMSWGRLKIIYR